jgi:regulatory protein
MKAKEEALKNMQRVCSGSEKCGHDIRMKLIKKGLNRGDIDWVIDQLKSDQFIDEERYAGFFVRDRFRLSGWGRIKISFALRQKQIPGNIIASQLESINSEEYTEKLRKILRVKNQKLEEGDDYKRKMKLMAFASQRGFEPDLIHKVVETLLD